MKKYILSKMAPLLLVSAFAVLSLVPGIASAAMNDYCQVPPYVIQNVPPNVVLLLDMSASMMEFAYFDSPSNRCTSSSNPCVNFDPSHPYYGYFDSTWWYTYSSNRFNRARAKSEGRPTDSDTWDGNFLNWLTMRKIDVARKVITGGSKTSGGGGGYEILRSEPPFVSLDGYYKRYGNVAPYTPFAGQKDFTFSAGTSGGTSQFTVSGEGTFRAQVQVPTPVEGVLQTVVLSRARIGLALFNDDQGAKISVPVTGSSLSGVINKINNPQSDLGTSTPIGESLWSITGYYALQDRLTGYASGPGPEYFSADIPNNANSDAMNYGSGGQARYPICAKNFVLLITDGEPCSDGNIPNAILDYAQNRSNYNCGAPNASNVCPAQAPFTSQTIDSPGCGPGIVAGLEDVALYGHTTDLRNKPTMGVDNIAGSQNYTLYVVRAFGTDSRVLQYAAINGGFEDSNANGIPDVKSEWDKNGDNIPDTYYEAEEGAELEQKVRDAFSSMLKRASSGTAASVLASGEGSGANLLQALFYPRRSIGDDTILWAGALQNLWYFVDPYFTGAYIRAETVQDNVLNLTNDKILQFYFNQDTQLTEVRLYRDLNGDGAPDDPSTPDNTMAFENVPSLWEGGRKLWSRSPTGRSVKTALGGSLIDFNESAASSLSTYLLPDAGDTAESIIRYVLGTDNTDDLNLRPRTVSVNGSDNNVWKLGDIVNSTPRIVGGVRLNKYDSVYNDSTYAEFINRTEYKNRGMVFAGGNDGMLHAFRLGKVEVSWTGQDPDIHKARIVNPYSEVLGDEAWAFIPKNALPYLKYLKDPDYCHLYYVDLSPYVFDASIQNNPTDERTADSWRTVLIGGMRTGGACANTCNAGSNCVKTPETDKGFSSYFALDVTDPRSPTMMWEFSNVDIPDAAASGGLGFASTGPAIVRIHAVHPSTSNRDPSLNGEWYVVIGSGPTGPIDNTNNQFLGRSNQQLRFFVLNLKSGALVQTISTGIPEAFAGSMINTYADFDLDYQDDAIYVGYVKKSALVNEWTDGGIGRIVTKNLSPGTSTPWVFSKVIDGIGPVTTAVSRLQNKNLSINWLYFGTGRYFFENPPTGTDTNPVIDDPSGQRRLFGIKEPCFTTNNTIDPTCTDNVAFSDLRNVTSISNVPTEWEANSGGFHGWYLDLDGSGNFSYDNTASRLFRSERVITDPLATISGVVFFTTYKPYGDECALGGKSFLWALKYNSGGAPALAVMKGKALVQVSTASVEQVDLSTAFTDKGGRRTAAIEGVPPTAQGLSLLSQPPPVKRILHMRER